MNNDINHFYGKNLIHGIRFFCCYNMVFSRGQRIFEWPTMHLSNEIHYYSRNGVSSTRENWESSSLNGQNNLILEMLNSVISWKRKSIYKIPIPTPFYEAMPKVTFSNNPPTIPAILPLAKSLLWSIQQRRKTLSQSSRPALFKFLMQHRFIPLCLYVHPSTSCVLVKGPLIPSGPAGTTPGWFITDLPT